MAANRPAGTPLLDPALHRGVGPQRGELTDSVPHSTCGRHYPCLCSPPFSTKMASPIMQRLRLIPLLLLSATSCAFRAPADKVAQVKAECGEDYGMLRKGMSEQRMLQCSFPSTRWGDGQVALILRTESGKVYDRPDVAYGRVYVVYGKVAGWSSSP